MARGTGKRERKKRITDEDILDAALALASTERWEDVTIWDIMQKAGGDPADFFRLFRDKTGVVLAYAERLDTRVKENLAPLDKTVPLRDRLFDVFMERLDLANENRAAGLSFARSFLVDSGRGASGLAGLSDSVRTMLDFAGMSTSGPAGCIKTALFTLGYLWVLRVWARDETPDLSRTMAALDQLLAHYDRRQA